MFYTKISIILDGKFLYKVATPAPLFPSDRIEGGIFMHKITDDESLISLLFARDESALSRLAEKYHTLLLSITRRILPDARDVEECVNDTYIRIWNAIPPEHPVSLPAYLSRVARNLALERYTYNSAAKRSSALTDAFEELEEFMLPSCPDNVVEAVNEKIFHDFINSFLKSQTKEARIFFLRRYWYGESIEEISSSCHVSKEKVKSSLFRTRNRLRSALEKEGIVL